MCLRLKYPNNHILGMPFFSELITAPPFGLHLKFYPINSASSLYVVLVIALPIFMAFSAPYVAEQRGVS
jgi:hypothetical protein